MKPGTFNLDLYRGDSYAWRFTLFEDAFSTVPVDLATATVKAEIRNASAGTTIVPLTAVITQPNIVDVSLTAIQSAALPAKGVWDLQLTFADLSVRTVVAGSVAVTGDVTDSVAAPATLNGGQIRAPR